MAFESSSTLGLSEERDVIAASSSPATGGGASVPGATVIPLDASGGNVTESLPPVSGGARVVALRTDTTSGNTATIKVEDTNAETIYWEGRGNDTSFDLAPRQPIYLMSDGSAWYVENPAVYEIGSFVPGALANGRILLRHRAEHDLETVALSVDCETADSNDPTTLNIFTGTAGNFGTATQRTISAGTNTTSFDIEESVLAEEVLKVTADVRSDIEDLSLTFDVIRA